MHLAGESFVSGHAVLVAALAGVITPYLPGRWKVVPWVLVAGVMFGRVYVGAHNPLDVICGAALGIAIAGAVNLATTLPWRRSAGSDDEHGVLPNGEADESGKPSSVSPRSVALVVVALVRPAGVRRRQLVVGNDVGAHR